MSANTKKTNEAKVEITPQEYAIFKQLMAAAAAQAEKDKAEQEAKDAKSRPHFLLKDKADGITKISHLVKITADTIKKDGANFGPTAKVKDPANGVESWNLHAKIWAAAVGVMLQGVDKATREALVEQSAFVAWTIAYRPATVSKRGQTTNTVYTY